jgi:hypothetical protein
MEIGLVVKDTREKRLPEDGRHKGKSKDNGEQHIPQTHPHIARFGITTLREKTKETKRTLEEARDTCVLLLRRR